MGKLIGRPPRPAEERFWSKVDKDGPGGCWEWTAGKDWDGYGIFHESHRRSRRAHRYAYELLVGPIPEGLTTDHLCRNRGCVNPTHLELVTPVENVMRGESDAAKNARKGTCKAGHPLSGPNLSIYARDGSRVCLECRRRTSVAYRKRKKMRS